MVFCFYLISACCVLVWFWLYVNSKEITDMSTLKEQIREIEKDEIIRALRECGWIMARAARKLGITERMIGYKIKKYEIRKEEKTWSSQRGEGGKE